MGQKLYKFILFAFLTASQAFSAHAQYMSTFAGAGTPGYSGDGGPASGAKFNAMTGMAADGAGNIYIADNANNVVRRIDNSGTISTFAGTGVAGYNGNGGLATAARLNKPMSVATDAAGNVYIADNGNHTIRVVNAFGVISNYAGNGIAGYTGDNDTAHLGMLALPQSIAMSPTGDLYIADAGNHAIRMVSNGSRIMTTIAGTGTSGSSGDGGMATDARLNIPSSVAVDASGNVYIADILNNKVRMVSGSTGIITTFAGTGVPGNSGNGGPATAALMSYPSGVSLDNTGNLYITDQGNHNVRMVNTSGIINHIAGTSVNGYSGDGGLATDAQLSAPKFVYVDGWNRIYIGDYGNHAIRKIVSTAGIASSETTNSFSVYPIPAKNEVRINLSNITNPLSAQVSDMLGRTLINVPVNTQVHTLNTSKLAPGIYTLSVIAADKKYTKRLVIE